MLTEKEAEELKISISQDVVGGKKPMMSNKYIDRFLESRYEEYIEQGYSPKDSEIMAYEDLEHDQYDYVPEEEETNES